MLNKQTRLNVIYLTPWKITTFLPHVIYLVITGNALGKKHLRYISPCYMNLHVCSNTHVDARDLVKNNDLYYKIRYETMKTWDVKVKNKHIMKVTG